jgi:hypothetical protein
MQPAVRAAECSILLIRAIFLGMLKADFAEFEQNRDSARHALNCVITAYHLHVGVG